MCAEQPGAHLEMMTNTLDKYLQTVFKTGIEGPVHGTDIKMEPNRRRGGARTTCTCGSRACVFNRLPISNIMAIILCISLHLITHFLLLNHHLTTDKSAASFSKISKGIIQYNCPFLCSVYVERTGKLKGPSSLPVHCAPRCVINIKAVVMGSSASTGGHLTGPASEEKQPAPTREADGEIKLEVKLALVPSAPRCSDGRKGREEETSQWARVRGPRGRR